MSWIFNPDDYEDKSFELIPVGDYRARISEVVEKTFNSGSRGYEVTMEISGFKSRVWHYLVLDESDAKRTNQRIGDLFNSFGITDPVLDHYHAWVGKVGGVRIKHSEYNGNTSAKVAFCLSKKNQEKLPPAQFGDAAPATAVPNVFNASDLPFDM